MFGLGDNTYQFFNRCSKTMQTCFKKYKMKEFYPYKAGSNHDFEIEKDFLIWKEKLIPNLQQNLPLIDSSNIKEYYCNFKLSNIENVDME